MRPSEFLEMYLTVAIGSLLLISIIYMLIEKTGMFYALRFVEFGLLVFSISFVSVKLVLTIHELYHGPGLILTYFTQFYFPCEVENKF
jgi:hypothetical protein